MLLEKFPSLMTTSSHQNLLSFNTRLALDPIRNTEGCVCAISKMQGILAASRLMWHPRGVVNRQPWTDRLQSQTTFCVILITMTSQSNPHRPNDTWTPHCVINNWRYPGPWGNIIDCNVRPWWVAWIETENYHNKRLRNHFTLSCPTHHGLLHVIIVTLGSVVKLP